VLTLNNKTKTNYLRLHDASGAGEARPAGFVSPDGTKVYSVKVVRDKTSIAAYDLRSGERRGNITLDGHYFAPSTEMSQPQLAISRDGRRMLLKRMPSE
jgi:hypothetical protein